MAQQDQPFIPYPAIRHHAVIGDRRTAALVASDGTIDWLSLPNYDGAPYLGTLLDVDLGGYWRFGPRRLVSGHQEYLDESAVAVTTWTLAHGELELTDFMPWPRERRPREDEPRRIVLRRVRCTRGAVKCAMRLRPRPDFSSAARARTPEGRWLFDDGKHSLGLWTTFPVEALDELDETVGADLRLEQGDEHWAVLALDEPPSAWSVDSAKHALEDTLAYWRDWLGNLSNACGPYARRMRRSGMAIHLLSFAPDGSLVAAPTTSLPERIGGSRNYDYRFAWVRDASLSVFGLARLGDQQTATRYLDWMAHLKSDSEMPVQVVYRISGETKLDEKKRDDLRGYRVSRPVIIGNRAARQVQPGSLGYLADCALEHLDGGGDWQLEYWQLIARCAEYVATHWREKDNGIWELPIRSTT